MLAQPRAYSPTPRLAKATPAASATVADAYGQSASLTQDVAGSSPVAPDIRGPPQDEPAEAIRKAPGTCVLERCLARTAVRRNSDAYATALPGGTRRPWSALHFRQLSGPHTLHAGHRA